MFFSSVKEIVSENSGIPRPNQAELSFNVNSHKYK